MNIDSNSVRSYSNKKFSSCLYTAHKMYFPILHGEHMEKWKEHFVRSVQKKKKKMIPAPNYSIDAPGRKRLIATQRSRSL
jgi:hypothetical protein